MEAAAESRLLKGEMDYVSPNDVESLDRRAGAVLDLRSL